MNEEELAAMMGLKEDYPKPTFRDPEYWEKLKDGDEDPARTKKFG